MATFTEGQRPYEFLLSEGNGTISRANITVKSGSGVMKAGTVLGKITATGKYEGYDDGNAGGSNAAAAILVDTIDATSADVAATAILRLAEVKYDALQWIDANDATSKTAAVTALAALNIIART